MSVRSRAGSLKRSLTNRAARLRRRLGKLPIRRLLDDMGRIPIRLGDSVFVHSRLSSVGYFDGDVSLVIENLIDRVGSEGNVLFPTFSFERGKTVHQSYAASQCFDVRSTPSTMGILTEIFRKRYAQRRSLHPSHSVAVWGNRSTEFTASHHLDENPFGECSPLYRFMLDPNAKVLLLGVNEETITCYRVYESLVKDEYPVKLFFDQPYEYSMTDEDGNEFTYRTWIHHPSASSIRSNAPFAKALYERGSITPYPTCNCTSFWVDGTDLYPMMEDLYRNGTLPYRGFF